MKYIRTEYGKIYNVSGQWFNKETGCYIDEHNKATSTQNCKQADTIEELCDGFVFKDTHTNELHFLDINSGISLLGASLFAETLKGFIKTDKGLIYVAKMNEKGELCLL